MVIVEPARFALTSTPSIAPSSCEVTVPASADADGVWALAVPANSTRPANAKQVRPDERVPRICLVILHPPSSLFEVSQIGRRLAFSGRHQGAFQISPLSAGILVREV